MLLQWDVLSFFCQSNLSNFNNMIIIKSFFDKWGKLKKDCQIDSLYHTAYSRSNFSKGLVTKSTKLFDFLPHTAGTTWLVRRTCQWASPQRRQKFPLENT
jgi:hypothetical protein